VAKLRFTSGGADGLSGGVSAARSFSNWARVKELTQPAGGVVAPALGWHAPLRVRTGSVIGTVLALGAAFAAVPGVELWLLVVDAGGAGGCWLAAGS